MGSAGHSGRTSDQFVAVEKIAANSALVTSVSQVFSLLTVIASASIPTWKPIGSRAGVSAAQLSTSLSLMAREALEMSVSPALQKRSKPAPVPTESIVRLPLKPSSSKRCFMRSESGKTVDEPAVTISPVTASGAYIAIGSSVGAAVGSAGAAVGSAGAVVGSTTGASVAGAPHAASRKLITMNTNINVRTNLVISFLLLIILYTHILSSRF